jgi:hypothetical protein
VNDLLHTIKFKGVARYPPYVIPMNVKQAPIELWLAIPIGLTLFNPVFEISSEIELAKTLSSDHVIFVLVSGDVIQIFSG